MKNPKPESGKPLRKTKQGQPRSKTRKQVKRENEAYWKEYSLDKGAKHEHTRKHST
jgi:hypothetical protein